MPKPGKKPEDMTGDELWAEILKLEPKSDIAQYKDKDESWIMEDILYDFLAIQEESKGATYDPDVSTDPEAEAAEPPKPESAKPAAADAKPDAAPASETAAAEPGAEGKEPEPAPEPEPTVEIAPDSPELQFSMAPDSPEHPPEIEDAMKGKTEDSVLTVKPDSDVEVATKPEGDDDPKPGVVDPEQVVKEAMELEPSPSPQSSPISHKDAEGSPPSPIPSPMSDSEKPAEPAPAKPAEPEKPKPPPKRDTVDLTTELPSIPARPGASDSEEPEPDNTEEPVSAVQITGLLDAIKGLPTNTSSRGNKRKHERSSDSARKHASSESSRKRQKRSQSSSKKKKQRKGRAAPIDPNMRGKKWKCRFVPNDDDPFDVAVRIVAAQTIDTARYKIPRELTTAGQVRFENLLQCLPEIARGTGSTKRHALVELRLSDPNDIVEAQAYKRLCSSLNKKRRGLVVDMKKRFNFKLYVIPPKQKKISSQHLHKVWGDVPNMKKYIWGFILFYT